MTQHVLFAACLVLAALVTLLQFLVARDELPGPFFTAGRWDTWCVHHDEKLVIPDVRAFFLGSRGPSGLRDYLPYPVCAAFGLAGPWLSVLGLRLCGFGNVGLRLWSLAALAARQYFFTALCFALLPPWPAAAVCCLQAVAYNQFVLDHHAVLENLLTLALVAIAWAFVVDPASAAAGAFGWGLAMAALVLVKPNFPATAGLLAACLLWTGPGGLGAVADLALGLGLGLAVFEAFQAVVLWRLGQLASRYRNLFDVLWIHSGREHDYLQKFIKPIGWPVIPRFFVLAVDWLADTRWRNVPAASTGPVVFAVLCVAFLTASTAAGPAAAGLFLFVLAQVLLLVPFYYYPKRAVPMLPLFSLLAALAALTWGRWLGVPGLAAWAVGLAGAGLALRNLLLLASRLPGRTRGVAAGSRELERLTAPGTRIRMQCYGYRFLWQARGRIMLSGDDQVLDNALTEEAARREDADYLLLSDLDPEGLARLSGEFRWLGRLTTAAADSDMPLRFDLFSRRKGHP